MPDNLTYLQNLAAGKTSTGGQATAGNIAWAKAQLAAAQSAAATAAQNVSTQVAAKPTGPVAGSQESHQAWINNPNSGQGGLEAYTSRQNEKYAQATQNNDADLLNKLKADAQRVGYTLNAPIAAPAMQSMSAPVNNSQGYIDSLSEARKNQKLADLGKARDASLSNLNAERATIQPKYYDARNQVAAGTQQQARNFAEFMAARGGTNSGANAQAELTRGMSLQGNLGSLGRQEAQAYGDIARRTSDLQNAYQSDVVSANAGVEADRMQALLNDHYQQQQRELQIAQLMGMYNGQQTLAGLQNSQQFGLQLGQLTGNYLGTPTLQAQQFQYAQDRDKVADSQWQQQFQYGQERDKVSDSQWNQQFQYTQGRDAVSDARWEQEFQRILKQDGVNNALSWAQNSISKQNANTSRMSANNSHLMDIWQATGSAPEGIPGVAAGTPYGSELDRSYRQAQVEQMSGKTNNIPYTQNQDFADDIAAVNANPAKALEEIRANAQEFIMNYGYEGYQALIKSAEQLIPKDNNKLPNSE